ncbi:hypothetical protein E8E11_010721 [Didymella keratinophila]|nr:hypothetical protein E8E11_010721 [Didymella keratinophila]
MCKVVKYWFACQHGFKLRHSRCGGVKHKSTRSGLATACRSDAYLEFVFAVKCGPCQYQAFEDGWKHKLKLADTFLDKLKEKGLPGVQEVKALVDQLKEDFNTATWKTRIMFPHAHKERTVRVGLGQFHRVPSPLSREVLPEDIPEPVEVIGPDHTDYEYDWDYVTSTDPVHPIDTNYAHPLDEADPAWLLNRLSPEELEQSGEGVGFDASETDMVWRNSLGEVNAKSADWVEYTSGWTSGAAGFDQNQTPGDSLYAEAAERQSKVCAEDDKLLSERIDMVIQYFWRAVNEINTSDQVLQTMTSVLGDDLDDAL